MKKVDRAWRRFIQPKINDHEKDHVFAHHRIIDDDVPEG